MLNFLEIAINEIEVNEIDEALDNLLEFEYVLFELERTEQIEEALELLTDIMKMLRHDEGEVALTYCHILIDIFTLNQVMDDKQSHELKKIEEEMKMARDQQPKTRFDKVQKEFLLKRLNSKMIRLLQIDHYKRFGIS